MHHQGRASPRTTLNLRAAEAHAVDRQAMAVPAVVFGKAAPDGFFDQVLARLLPSKGGKSRIAV